MTRPSSPQSLLSYEQAPPISVPFRFFLTAPLFGIAAGLLLIWVGPEALASRWMPGTLAVTHLLTVGFMLQAMCGALLQLIPVAAGGNVWRPRLVASIVHPTLVAAAIFLVAAFTRFSPPLFLVAASLFALALTFFLIVVGIALVRTNAKGATVLALRMALPGLLMTLIFGLLLAVGQGLGMNIPFVKLTNTHALWGLGGWGMTLLAGASYLLVPMFQLTPPYPSRLARAIPIMLLVAGIVIILQVTETANYAGNAGYALALVAATLFAGSTIYLQQHRRRRVMDTSFHFFRGSMVSILLVSVSQFVFLAYPQIGEHPRAPVWLGVLVLVGVFVSAINGTLYKILPFLCWLHRQRNHDGQGRVPNMKQIISDNLAFRQMSLHFAAYGLMLMSVLIPDLTRLAGLFLASSFCLLEWNLISGVRVYLGVPTSRR